MVAKHIKLIVTKPKLPKQFALQRQKMTDLLATLDQVEVVYHPVFELVPKQAALSELPSLLAQLKTRSQKTLVVFVSPSAIEFGLNELGKWPNNLYCGVMGHQSAQVAITLGVPENQIIAPKYSDQSVSEDSAGLEQLIHQYFQTKTTEILILNGKSESTDLETNLLNAGFNVSVRQVYESRPVVYPERAYKQLVNSNEALFFWFTSSSAIYEFTENLKKLTANQALDQFSQAYCLVTHQRIFQAASTVGFQRIEMIPTGVDAVIIWLKRHQESTIALVDNENLQIGLSVTNSDSQNTTNTTENGDVKKASAEAAVKQPDSTPTPTPTPTPRSLSPSNSVKPKTGLFAVFIACVALFAVVGLAFLGQSRLEHAKQLLVERIQEDKTRLVMMQETLQNADGMYRDLKVRFEQLQATQKESQGQQELLQQVYEDLIGSRTAVSLSEIHQLVSIAKRQLFVLGNVEGAKVALQQAVELLERTDKPSLIAVRTNIEKDLAALNAVKQIDLIALAIQLDSIINSVDTLPTLSATNAVVSNNFESGQIDQNEGEAPSFSFSDDKLLQSAWDGFKYVMSTVWEDILGLVEITEVDDPDALMMSAKQRLDIKNTLRLSLLNARLSLISRHAELLTSDINRSRALLSTYFDQSNAQVTNALRVLEKIGQVQIEIALPELSNSTASVALAMQSERKLN